MKKALGSHSTRAKAPGGFTLIELMVVIVIITILLALLLPAIGSARRTVRDRQVRSEISALENALADFKATFGMYPPSRITLYESQAGWNGDNRSRGLIRRLWPRFDFSINRDLNGDSDSSDSYALTGPQCLAFFLGGMNKSATGVNQTAMIGFAKNPANPFSRSGDNRVGPFFEFDPGRLQVSGGYLAYRDPLPGQQNPYIYASAYDGRGYNTADVALTYVYHQNTNTGPVYKSKSFQIISPGADTEYGVGGGFDPETADTTLVGTRQAERDNITNFHGGRLAP